MRAKEKFSGRGHARHLCKDCARLGKEELVYRQSVRNLERLLTWDGRVPRENRKQFKKYLNHENERVRAFATELESTRSRPIVPRKDDGPARRGVSIALAGEGKTSGGGSHVVAGEHRERLAK
jgi:hypothetical protein